MILDVSVKKRDGFIWHTKSARDIVITGRWSTQALRLKVLVDDELLWELRGNGVIISTPLGAGEYASRVGGIWMDPYADALMITPVCDHSTNVRPFVVNKRRKIVVLQNECDYMCGQVIIDGEDSVIIQRKESVTVVLLDSE